MPSRYLPTQTNEIYHVMNKSIEGFQIFNRDEDYSRMLRTICYYQGSRNQISLSDFLKRPSVKRDGFENILQIENKKFCPWVKIIAYCLMPTHTHFALKQLVDNGISNYMKQVEGSYARYFNTLLKRKGPLWVGRFKRVHVDSDEQLLHLTRYIHLNPVSAGLVEEAKQWKYSSIHEYVTARNVSHKLCQFDDLINMSPQEYDKFVKGYAREQRELAVVKAG